jgi:hypothetical protein
LNAHLDPQSPTSSSTSTQTSGPAPLFREIVLVPVFALEMVRRTVETLRILVTIRPKPLSTSHCDKDDPSQNWGV